MDSSQEEGRLKPAEGGPQADYEFLVTVNAS